ncbi:MAG: transposase [Chloroflexi bacterium]|nr:transposase [Chloroflexota bacterium]MCI0729115.1 transposase [Chloroflexota bacterium]
MTTIHQCECEVCQQSEVHPDQALHRQMNLFMSRLDEQQRRWYAALEAKKVGREGATLLTKVTGLSVETIRRGRRELDNELAARPVDRVRQAGGGRKAVEKKHQLSR